MRHCAMIAALLGVLALAQPAVGQMYLEFAGATSGDIPANCSEWQELHPTFGLIHHQDEYIDNGDGNVSVCDQIVLEGVQYHVDWVGPTYVVEQSTAGIDEPERQETRWYEPTELIPPANPVCSTWHQVHPGFCQNEHVDDWLDFGDGVVSVGDVVWFGDVAWVVVEVNLDIAVTESPSPAYSETWSVIKHLFATF